MVVSRRELVHCEPVQRHMHEGLGEKWVQVGLYAYQLQVVCADDEVAVQVGLSGP